MLKVNWVKDRRWLRYAAVAALIGAMVIAVGPFAQAANAEGMTVKIAAGANTLEVAAPTPPPVPTPPAGEDQRILTGDQVVSGDTFTLRSNEILRGDLTVFGGKAILEEGSRVEGNVTIFGGNADISGIVTRNLTIIGGSTHLQSSAQIQGSESAMGGQIQIDPGAVVNGQATRFNGSFLNGIFSQQARNLFHNMFDVIGNIFGAIFSVLLITLLAIAVAALFPVNVIQVAETAQQQWLVAGSVGILSFVAVPIVVAILAITICLIPAALVLALAWALGILVGWVVVARILGERLAIGFNKRNWTMVGQTAIGALVLGILGALPVIGWLIGLAAAALGMGAMILTRAGTIDYPPAPPMAPAGPPAQTPALPA